MATLPRELESELWKIRSSQASLLAVRSQDPSLQSARQVNYEFEIRFKSYRVDAFRHGVPYRDYDRLRQAFRNMNLTPTIVKSTDLIKRLNKVQIRRTLIRDDFAEISDAPIQEIWIRKTSISKIDDQNYFLRYAFSQEVINGISDEDKLKFVPDFERNKYRESYDLAGGAFRLDLTDITTKTGHKYEVELEVINFNKINGELVTEINRILKYLHDTEVVYSSNEYQSIVNFYNNSLKATGPFVDRFTFNHRILFQSRNLHYKDMVGGGLIGNLNYTYKVTIKADGVRKILCLHSSGLWLIGPPDDANLVIRFVGPPADEINSLIGTILEGELIPMNKRRLELTGAPRTKYWYLIYDCLARSARDWQMQPDRWGDMSIQEERHGVRMAHAKEVEGKFRDENSLILIETKQFYPEDERYGFRTSDELFTTIYSLEYLKPTNLYHDDGYIFMPAEMPYNPKVDYKNTQTRESIWHPTDKDIVGERSQLAWQNNQNWQMYEDGGDFIDKGGSFADDEVRWFTDSHVGWKLSGNKWTLQRQRLWSSIDPKRPGRHSGGRRMREVSGTIIRDGQTLIKTIKTIEYGSGHISKIPLELRKLTRYPDICKWKSASDLTNDFAIEWTVWAGQPRLILNMSGPDLPGKWGQGSFVRFTGTEQFPLITDPNEPFGPIDWDNELTKNKPSGTIVEYQWKENLLVPVRIRDDKSKPNKISFAKDNWNQVQYPIDILTLRGETFKLMSRYHNIIKFELYSSAYKRYKSLKIADSPFNGPTLLDIGSGQGGDVLKWKESSRIIAVEPNQININELIIRIRNVLKQNEIEVIENMSDRMNKINLAEMRGDRVVIIKTGGENTELISAIVSDWFRGKADIIALMLSMSFFWQSRNLVARLYQTIIRNISPTGQCIFLTIDGQLVKHAFSPAKLTNGMSIGGQRSDLDFMQLGPATLRYYKSESRLDITIPNSILQNALDGRTNDAQTEWLVILKDLEPGLKSKGWVITNLRRADQEQLLNEGEGKLTRLYTAGEILPMIGAKPSIKTVSETKLITTISKESVTLQQRSKRVTSPQINIPVRTTPPLSVSKTQNIILPSQLPEQSGQIEVKTEQPLPMLPITYDPKRDIGIGDDAVETIKVKWYDQYPVVRIATIGDGSCFFHALLKSFYGPYANNRNYSNRSNMVKMLRRDLAYLLSLPDPAHPGMTFYETAANGAWVEFLGLQLAGADLGNGVDYRLEGIETLFNSSRDVGQEVYQYTSDMLGVNIYVTLATTENLKHVSNTFRPEREDYPSVVIAGNKSHYEVVGLDLGFDGIQTVFYKNSSFLQALQRQTNINRSVYS